MRLPAFLLFVLLLAGRLFAQQDSCTLTLSGRVLDEHDRSPLAFTRLSLQGTAIAVEADGEGRFSFPRLCPGRYTVRIAHVGCAPRERVVVLARDLRLDLFLEHHADELEELRIARERPDEHVGQGREELDAEAIRRKADDGLAAVLEQVPGVSVLRSGPTIGKPVIHGLSGNRVVILNQGVRQQDQQWGEEHAPNLDPLSSDRITVVKGAAGVQYGADAIAGVVVVEAVELPMAAGLRGDVRSSGRSNGLGIGGAATLEGGVRGWRGAGWRVQGSGRSVGDAHTPEHVLSNTGMQEQAASVAFGWRDVRRGARAYYSAFRRELGIMRTAHIGNITDLRNAMATSVPWYTAPYTRTIDAPRQTAVHHLLKFDAYHFLSERDQLVFTYAYQSDERQEYDIRRAGRSARPALDLYLTDHTADVVLKHYLGDRIHGRLGVVGALQQNTNVPGTGVQPLIPNYRRSSAALFLLEHFPVNERFELEAGARLEATALEVFRYDEAGKWEEPQHHFSNRALTVGANWAVRDSLRLRFGISSAYRPPHVSELYSNGLHHGAAAVELGDPGLKAERAWSANVDGELRACAGRLRLGVGLHASRIADFINLRPDGIRLTIRGAFPVFRYVATDAFLYGADATAQWRFDRRWSLRTRWSVLRAHDLAADTWLFRMPGDRAENTLFHHWAGRGAWQHLEVGVISTTAFHQHRVPAGVDFMDPPAGYHLLGLSASVKYRSGGGTLHLGVEGYNLLNTRYRDIMDRFRYYADARGADLMVVLRYAFGRERPTA